MLYVIRILFPKPMISINNKYVICSKCGWTGHYNEAKHKTQVQLEAQKIMNNQGFIIDPYILKIKKQNGGWIDLTWCPSIDNKGNLCDTFIEIYYDDKKN